MTKPIEYYISNKLPIGSLEAVSEMDTYTKADLANALLDAVASESLHVQNAQLIKAAKLLGISATILRRLRVSDFLQLGGSIALLAADEIEAKRIRPQ